MLDHRRLSRALAGCPIGHEVVHAPTLASTNDEALRLGSEGFPNGLVVIADEQTQGRGRRGSIWESPPGLNLYISILLRPETFRLELPHWPRLTHTAGLAIARCVDQHVPRCTAQIKWPNDVYINGKKIAGILTETGHQATNQAAFAVVGIGVNVLLTKEDLPKEIQSIATSLQIEAPEQNFSREAVAAKLAQELAKLLPLVPQRFSAILSEISARSYLLGHEVVWETEQETRTGIAECLDEEGRLLVRIEGGNKIALNSVEKIRRLADL